MVLVLRMKLIVVKKRERGRMEVAKHLLWVSKIRRTITQVLIGWGSLQPTMSAPNYTMHASDARYRFANNQRRHASPTSHTYLGVIAAMLLP